jgi:hypothetical protein
MDVRFHPSGYNQETKNEINGIAVMMTGGFSSYIAFQEEKEMWFMPNTTILVINCSDFKNDDNFYNYTKIGEKKFGWISEVRVRMMENDFLKLDEKGKMLLILDKIKEGLLKFIALFPELSFDKQKITNAYKKIINDNFYIRYTTSYFTKDNKFECWMEVLSKHGKRIKQLVLNDSIKISKYFIAEEYWGKNIFDDACFLKIIGKGWRNHKFYFRYGTNEKYQTIVFDADKRTIERIE